MIRSKDVIGKRATAEWLQNNAPFGTQIMLQHETYENTWIPDIFTRYNTAYGEEWATSRINDDDSILEYSVVDLTEINNEDGFTIVRWGYAEPEWVNTNAE